MKTQLTATDRQKVWRALDPDWMHYAFCLGHWRAYPVDPRRSPGVASVVASEHDGVVDRRSGFTEA